MILQQTYLRGPVGELRFYAAHLEMQLLEGYLTTHDSCLGLLILQVSEYEFKMVLNVSKCYAFLFQQAIAYVVYLVHVARELRRSCFQLHVNHKTSRAPTPKPY